MLWLKRTRAETVLHSQVLILCFETWEKETRCLIHDGEESGEKSVCVTLSFWFQQRRVGREKGVRRTRSCKAGLSISFALLCVWRKLKFICVYSFFDSLLNWQRFMRDVVETRSAALSPSFCQQSSLRRADSDSLPFAGLPFLCVSCEPKKRRRTRKIAST